MNLFHPPTALALTDQKIDALRQYKQELIQWNSKINLISKSTQKNIDQRHLNDCLGLVPFLPKHKVRIVDMGSGAGLPGIVIAIATYHHVTMIESTRKKCDFLQHIQQKTAIECAISNSRIESHRDRDYDIVTARALANLSRLWQWSIPLLKPQGYAIYLKGDTPKTLLEIEQLQQQYTSLAIKSYQHPFCKGRVVFVSQQPMTRPLKNTGDQS